MKKLKLDEFLNYRFLSAAGLSPDGRKAAFVVKKADSKKKDYDSCIWMCDPEAGTMRQLTAGGGESSFLFEDNDTILFRAERKEEDKPEPGKEKTVFYRISLSGGEAARAFELPYEVSEIKRVKAGLYAFTAVTDRNRPDGMSEEEAEEYGDYHVLTELPYWANGRDFVSGLRESLFLYRETDGTCEKLTGSRFTVGRFCVSEERIFYFGTSYDELLPFTSGLYAFDPENGNTVMLVEEGTWRMDQIACEGSDVYFTATDMKTWGAGETADLYRCAGVQTEGGASGGPDGGKVCPPKPHTMEKLHRPDYSIGFGLTSDCTLGSGSLFLVRDGVLYFTMTAADGKGCVSSELYRLTDDGQAEKVFSFAEGCVDCFDVRGSRVAFVGREPLALQEFYFADLSRNEGSVTRLTGWNREVLKDTYVADCVPAGFTNSDGVEIDGWVLAPKGYFRDEAHTNGAPEQQKKPDKRYPAILDMHGGPRAAFGRMFFHEMQYWANEGYFVFCCNPRGSDSKGDAFADLRGKWGDTDYKDFMEFTDHVLNEYPAIDPKRVGVTGGSYGGFMTNWIIGHTGRFAAAASQRSFSNWLSDFGCSEIGFSFDVNEVGATPWQDPKRLWENSPVRYADRVTTPTLFIHSLKDYNCPLSEGMQMFAALKYHHVPSRACLFEGENHELSRSGKPKHRIRRLSEITAWMDQYLKQEGEME